MRSLGARLISSSRKDPRSSTNEPLSRHSTRTFDAAVTVADRFCLVDFPGYGYAKAPEKIRKAWKPLIQSYLNGRTQLKLALLLLDSRREPRKEEFELAEAMKALGVPLLIIVTKTDKLPKTRRHGRVQRLGKAMGVGQGNALGYSALKKEGRKEILDRIYKEVS